FGFCGFAFSSSFCWHALVYHSAPAYSNGPPRDKARSKLSARSFTVIIRMKPERTMFYEKFKSSFCRAGRGGVPGLIYICSTGAAGASADHHEDVKTRRVGGSWRRRR